MSPANCLEQWRSGELGSDTATRLTNLVFLSFAISAVLFVLAIEIEASVSGVRIFAIAWAVFFLPWLGFVIVLRRRMSRLKQTTGWQEWLVRVAYASGAALAGFGHVHALNAVLGTTDPVVVQGRIEEISQHSSRYTGLDYTARLRTTDGTLSLILATSDGHRYQVGECYSRTLWRGGFGYLYRWKWADVPIAKVVTC